MNYAIGGPALTRDGYGYWDELLIAVSSAASFFVIFIRRCKSQTAINNSSQAQQQFAPATAVSLFSIKSCSFGSHIFKPSIAI